MAEIVAEYKLNVDKAVTELRKVADATEGTDKALGNVGKTSKKVSADMSKDLEGVKDVASQISPEFGRAASAMGALTGGVGKVVTAMRTLRGAIIATGIGALVVIIATVASAATRMQGVMDKLRVVFAGVSAAVAQVRDRMADFGAGLLDIVRGDFSAGFDKMKASVTGLGAAMSDANEKAKALEERLMTLERSKMMTGAATRKLEAEIQKLNATFGDETVSIQEQLDAQKEILRLREMISDSRKDEARQLIAVKLNQLEANEATDAFIEMMRDESTLAMTHEQRRDKAIEQLSKLGLSYSNIKDDLGPMIELINEYTDAESIKFEGIFRGNQRINALQHKIHSEEVERQKELARLEAERKKAADEAADAAFKLAESAAKKAIELQEFVTSRTAMSLREEMQMRLNAEQDKLALAETTAYQIGLSEDEIQRIRDASVNEQLRIQADYHDKVSKMEEEGVEAVKRVEEEKVAIRKAAEEKMLQDFSQYAQAAIQLTALISQAQQQATDNELAQLQNALDSGQITREEYDQKRRQLLREQARQDKEMALLQAVIATAAAIAEALPNVPLSIIAGVLGAAQIAVIASQPLPQFEEGGRIGGKRHSQGGTVIEAEVDEFVVNRKAYLANTGLVEAINKGMGEAYIMRKWVAPAVDSALLNGWQDVGKSAELNNLTANLKDHNIIAAMDRNRQATTYGLKLLADKLDRRTPKRGGYA